MRPLPCSFVETETTRKWAIGNSRTEVNGIGNSTKPRTEATYVHDGHRCLSLVASIEARIAHAAPLTGLAQRAERALECTKAISPLVRDICTARRKRSRMGRPALRSGFYGRYGSSVQFAAGSCLLLKELRVVVPLRRAKNKVTELDRPDGSTCTDPIELAGMTKEFCANLYTSEEIIGMEEVLSHIPVRVDAQMNARRD